MIDPRDMTDHQLIAELQGWLPFLVNLKRAKWGKMGERFNAVTEEFVDRMITGRSVLTEPPVLIKNTPLNFPSFGTKEDIEEERERMQEVVGRLPGPRLEF